MTAATPADPKARIVYWGLFLVFVVKFCKFVVLGVWDAVGSLFAAAP